MRNKVLLILAVLVLMASAAAAPALAEPVEKATTEFKIVPAEEAATEAVLAEEAVPAEKVSTESEAAPVEKAAPVEEVATGTEIVSDEEAATEQPRALLPEGFECEPGHTSLDGSISTNDCVLRPAHEDEQDGNEEDDPETWISIHCVPGSELIKGDDPSGREHTCVPGDEEAVSAEHAEKLSEGTATPEEAAPAEKAATASEVASAEQEVAAEQPQALLPEDFECEPSYTSPDGSISTNDCVLRPAHDEDGQGDNGVVHGCPEDYYYDEDLGRCSPDGLLLGGLTEMPDSLGESVGWLGILPADSLKGLGLGTWGLLDYAVGDTLSDWGEELGGPLGYGLKGLGGIFGFTGTVGGGLLESAGHGLGDLSDALGGFLDDFTDDLGEAAGEWADDVGDAAEDTWDAAGDAVEEVGSWLGF